MALKLYKDWPVLATFRRIHDVRKTSKVRRENRRQRRDKLAPKLRRDRAEVTRFLGPGFVNNAFYTVSCCVPGTQKVLHIQCNVLACFIKCSSGNVTWKKFVQSYKPKVTIGRVIIRYLISIYKWLWRSWQSGRLRYQRTRVRFQSSATFIEHLFTVNYL